MSADEADALSQQGHQPGDGPWEERGICRSVTWPRSKYTILGRRDDGSSLVGDYYTARKTERRKQRNFKYLSFISPSDFRLPKGVGDGTRAANTRKIISAQRALVALINGLPQDKVTSDCRFIVDKDHKASVLFDPEATESWLSALEEQDHITDLYVVAQTKREFEAIKTRVDELLGDVVVQEEQKLPMANGFAANLAYFKLDFLDKDRIELGAAFREILPLLWLKASAVGPPPELAGNVLPNWFAPKTAKFAVLLTESRIRGFLNALKGRSLSHVFIVTNADESFRSLSEELRIGLGSNSGEIEFVQLYRDYLMNFIINTRTDEPVSQGSTL